MRRRKNQNQLNERQFKALIENAHEGIVLYDLKGKIKYVSQSACKIFGYKEPEALQRAGTEFLHPDDAEENREAFFKLVNKPGKSITLFQRIRHKKGHYLWSESKLTNFSHVPEINGIVSNFRDITEKKLAEEKVRETQQLLETINRNLTEGIFMGTLHNRFVYANEAFLKITGYKSFTEIQNIKSSSLFANETHRSELVEQLLSKEKLKDAETIFFKKNGQTFWASINVRLLKHEGKENYFVGTIRDITKEKKAELALIESRNFFNNIINNVASPILVKDEKHRWIMFNEKFCELMGVPRNKLVGKTEKDFFNDEEARADWKIDNEVIRTGKTRTYEKKITFRGENLNLLIVKSSYCSSEKGERFVICSIIDITYLKKTEEKIKHLHENLQGVLESSKESIFSVDSNFCYTAFNQHHKDMMKLLFDADIEIGKNKIEYLKDFPDAKWIKTELSKALKGNQFVTSHVQDYPNYKGYIQTTYNPVRDEKNKVKGIAVFVQDITERKRFEEIIKSINANLRAVIESTSDRIVAIDTDYRYIMFNHAYQEKIKRLTNKEIKVGDAMIDVLPELSFITKAEIKRAFKGEHFTIETERPNKTILETSYNPIYDDKNKVTGVAMFIRDITGHKRMEEQLKTLNRELTEQNWQLAAQEEELKATLEELSERNFELDQLMYKTSHDLRSPLSSIMGLINLAHIDPGPNSYKEYLEKIEGRVKRLDEFISSMLDIARVNRMDVELEYIDLPSLIQSCINELEYLDNFSKMKTGIYLNGPKTSFTSDRLRLKIIFSNILSNAYKYYNPESESSLQIFIEVKPDSASIVFEDNGIGIKEEHMNKIFNMFYRATDRSQGSGLGMYIVKQAVEKLNGEIAIESEYGKGTRIQIVLPNVLHT